MEALQLLADLDTENLLWQVGRLSGNGSSLKRSSLSPTLWHVGMGVRGTPTRLYHSISFPISVLNISALGGRKSVRWCDDLICRR